MKSLFRILNLLVICLLLLSLHTSCSKDMETSQQPPSTVADLAATQPDLSTFLKILQLSGQENYFNSGAFTFFAPTDSAFTVFMDDKGINSFAEFITLYNGERLKNLLLYHVLEKPVRASEISNSYVPTAATNQWGDKLDCYTTRSGMYIILNGQAHVVDGGIIDSKVIIHKINMVMHPLTLQGLVAVNPSLSKLATAIKLAGSDIDSLLNQADNAYTLLAPTDEAFNVFLNSHGYSNVQDMLADIGPQGLADLLKYHILTGNIKAEDLSSRNYSTILANFSFTVSKDNSGAIFISDNSGNPGVNVVSTNFTALNGTMHIIDHVLEY